MGVKTDQLDFGPMVAFYERVVDPLTLPIGLRAINLCDLGPGDKVIDVAAGTGALAVEAARRGICVLATDIEPNMVARSAERLASFSNCEARVMRFDVLDVPDGSFDAALSIVGVLAFSNGRAGLRELVRVTREGGLVAVGTWDQERPEAPQYLAYDVFAALFPGRQLWPADFFPIWSKADVGAALRDAGCSRAEGHEVKGEWAPPSRHT
jgi:ubiquinone/menaquinone biosynthesis C-methylase UbiE